MHSRSTSPPIVDKEEETDYGEPPPIEEEDEEVYSCDEINFEEIEEFKIEQGQFIKLDENIILGDVVADNNRREPCLPVTWFFVNFQGGTLMK